MKWTQAFKMAFRAISGNKMRSFLTMLGIIIGVLSVTALVALGEGSSSAVTDQITSLGTNMITVSVRSQRDVHVKLEELMELRGQGGVSGIAPTLSSSLTLKAGTNTHDTTVEGTTPDYETIRNVSVASGRFIIDMDVSRRNAVAVVGVDVADELFGHRDVVGESIRIDGRKYAIVGVLEEKGENEMLSTDDYVLIPFTTAQRHFKNTTISSFYASAATEESVDTAVSSLESFMYRKTGDEDGYSVTSQSQLLDVMSSVTGTLTLMLAGIAGISLLVGGIGIMNIMLVSVTERTREIGIRKAIGAQRLDIMSQFLIEAVVLSLVGGIIGLGLGYLVSYGLSSLMGIKMVVSNQVAGLALLFSMVVGVVFGCYPANKASKLLPIEALRYE